MDEVEPPPARRRRKLEAEPAGAAGGIFDDLYAWFWDSPIEQNGSATAATSSPSGETFHSSHNQDGYTANADAAGPLHEMPQFTSRDEMLEFQSLTGEEIVAGEADVLGLTAEGASASIGREGSFIASLDAEIALIPDADKQAYVEAMLNCPELIDVEHKKSFIWREGYDTKAAAKRLVNYWEERRSLFGQDKFYLPLTPRGALRDDTVAIRYCVLSILPEKDSKGRTVLFWQPSNYDSGWCSDQSMMRACWLVVNTMTLDPISQRRGFVLLLSPSRPSRSKMEFAKNVWRLETTCMPIICRGIHFCKPGPLFHLLNPILKFILGKRLRGRLKVHYGTNEEVLKSLKEYGIQRGNIPMQLGGDLVLDQDQWLADRFADDATASKDGDTNEELVESNTASKGCAKNPRAHGRRGDPRMNSAVKVKVERPEISLRDALLKGGFIFPEIDKLHVTPQMLLDTEGVSLWQRKNQLMRRLRQVKKKKKIEDQGD